MAFIPAKPCRRIAFCPKTNTPYCVKKADGTLEQRIGSSACPPCSSNVSYYRGYCPGASPKSQ